MHLIPTRLEISPQDAAGDRSMRPPAYSYHISARTGARAVATLRKDLVAEHCSVWQDILALEGNRDWWLGITAAALRRGCVGEGVHSAQNISKSLWPITHEAMLKPSRALHQRHEHCLTEFVRPSPEFLSPCSHRPASPPPRRRETVCQSRRERSRAG